MSAISVFQNNQTAAMLVSQTNPGSVEPFFYVKTFFLPLTFYNSWPLDFHSFKLRLSFFFSLLPHDVSVRFLNCGRYPRHPRTSPPKIVLAVVTRTSKERTLQQTTPCCHKPYRFPDASHRYLHSYFTTATFALICLRDDLRIYLLFSSAFFLLLRKQSKTSKIRMTRNAPQDIPTAIHISDETDRKIK